jgi:hypothetical protein
MQDWLREWTSEDYKGSKRNDIDVLIKYFQKSPPKNLLDIGCGMAWESRALQKVFDTKLWLLDGDADSNQKQSRETKWNPDIKKMAFYHKLDQLDSALKETGLKKYKLIDCNNINIPEDIKFDLIYSGMSCGFHYEANTYRTLIEKHSHPDTKIIFDLRSTVMYQNNVEILQVLYKAKKYNKCLIRFKD